MYRLSDLTKQVYKVHEVAEILGVTTTTVRNYDRDNKIKTVRTTGNHRVVTKEDLINYLKVNNLLIEDDNNKVDVIYARVSSHDQKKHGDLDRQVVYLLESVDNIKNPVVLKEVGSGLNDKRVQLQKLLRMVCNNEVRNVYVTYEDRLTRFGFNYLSTMFEAHGVHIIVVKDEKANKSVQEEIVEDKMSLIASLVNDLRSMNNKDIISVEEIISVLE